MLSYLLQTLTFYSYYQWIVLNKEKVGTMEMKYSKNGIGKTSNFVTRGEETSKQLTAYRVNGEAFNTGFFFFFFFLIKAL